MKRTAFSFITLIFFTSFAWSANLTLTTPYEKVPFGAKFKVQASGGVAPYSYRISYGPASISSSGLVTAGEKNGQVKVIVTDANKKSEDVRFRVLKGSVIVVPPGPQPSPTPMPTPTPTPAAVTLFKVPAEKPAICQWKARVSCETFKYTRRIDVGSSTELSDALVNLKDGDLVAIKRGNYSGKFVINLNATNAAYVCADEGALIDAGNIKSGYGLHINKARNIIISGVAVANAQKGIMIDNSNDVVLHKVSVSDIGDEAVHFRNNTKNSVLVMSKIQRAGLYQPDFGEGVYLGSSKNKWCPDSAKCGEPDRSDCNLISENRIENVRAESVDIKEGTQNNVILGNTFIGTGMTGAWADSFIDVKGNLNLILGNVGQTGVCGTKSCQLNGFQTHIAVPGWGERNTFSKNRVVGDIEGPVVSLQKPLGNIVACDNSADNGMPASSGNCQ